MFSKLTVVLEQCKKLNDGVGQPRQSATTESRDKLFVKY